MFPPSRSKVVVACAVAAVSIPLSLTACSSGGSGTANSGAVKSIRVVDGYTSEPDSTNYKNLLEKCGTENGVTIEREAIPGSSLIPKVLQMVSSKTMPDILNIDNPDLPQIAATGALTPLSDLGITDGGEAKGVVDAGSFQGKLYAVQPITNTIALFYNKDIFEKAGVQPPQTWEELKAAATKLTSGKQYGIAFSAPATYEGTWQFLPFMWSNGGDEKDITSSQTAEALQLWQDLVKNGSASQSVVNWSQSDVNDQFSAGNAAMMINGPWQYPVLAKNADLHYGVVPIPTPSAGDKSVAPLGGEVWAAPNTGDSAKQAAAAKVLNCINSDENQLSLATARKTVPTKTALQEKFVQQNPDMKAFSDMLPDLRSRTGELGDKFPATATKIYNAVQLALVGGKSPEEALKQASNG